MTHTNVASEIETKLKSDWPEGSAEQKLCLKVFEYISNNSYMDVQHLTPHRIKSLIKDQIPPNTLFSVLTYLAGSRVNLLNTKFELVDEDEIPCALNDDDIEELETTGRLHHPDTGTLVDSPKDKVFMFFSPSEIFR